jgi:hypothetical protein
MLTLNHVFDGSWFARVLGMGGINLSDIQRGNRTGCHAQIFFAPESFDYFFRNQRIKHRIARVIAVWRANASEIRLFFFEKRNG